MSQVYKTLFIAICYTLTYTSLYATHNRAGEITYIQTGPLTILCTITTYTKSSSTAADRDSLVIIWGDGTAESVGRSNGPKNKGVDIGNNIKYNTYIKEHTFPSRGTYVVSMQDPNRVGNIVNIPGSVNVPFYIETKITLLDPRFQGFNNSAILLQPPIDIGCVNKRFIHNPNAYDPDGDSLAYELVPPFIAPGTPVDGYSFPDEIFPGPDNNISLDPLTGTFIWDSPKLKGEYNIAIRIKEYRQGVLINALVRDMQIYISECEENLPPQLSNLRDQCVIAGDTIDFRVVATDPNTPLQKLRLRATGNPFIQSVSPATFSSPSGFAPQPVIGRFHWNTLCDHIAKRNYSVVFHATDDYFTPGQSGVKDTLGLSNLSTYRVKIVGAAPKEVRADRTTDNISISWEAPYDCDQAPNFLGFKVWRSDHSVFIPVDTCHPGLDGTPYRIIKYNTLNKVLDRFVFLDEDTERGKTYCYRITASFGQLTSSGTPYNIVESLPSDEVCINLTRDLPLLTHADIRKTHPSDGSVLIRWTKPLPKDLDTSAHKGPYTFQLLKEMPNGTFTPLPDARFVTPTLDASIDTMYIDTPVATDLAPHTYKIAFYTAENSLSPYGTSDQASSPFLQLREGDHQIKLEVEANVPWSNYNFVFMRRSSSGMKWQSIGQSEAPVWLDKNLSNDSTYCYKVQTIGAYGLPGILAPLINHSQEICGSPHDTVPPCTPEIKVSNICTNPDLSGDSLYNQISWKFSDIQCTDEDGLHFNIYFAPTSQDTGELIATFYNVSGTWQIDHFRSKSLEGCYWVTALDSLENESPPSTKVCTQNCPDYKLPNTFTPNGDGQNDLFIPFPYRFVSKIDFKVYNEWGGLVFKTSNPDILWDGTNINGKKLSDGVYFYTCAVYTSTTNDSSRPSISLKGFIHIINNK